MYTQRYQPQTAYKGLGGGVVLCKTIEGVIESRQNNLNLKYVPNVLQNNPKKKAKRQEKKTLWKIVHSPGPSNSNLGIFGYSFISFSGSEGTPIYYLTLCRLISELVDLL